VCTKPVPRKVRPTKSSGPCRRAGQRTDRRTDLFLRARAGQPELFGVLADEITGLLLRSLQCGEHTQALCNAEDRLDVVQETFLKAWANRYSFDATRSSVVTWLGVIAHNTAVSMLRKRRTMPTRSLQALHTDNGLDVAAGGCEPVEVLVAQELEDHLHAAIAAVEDPVRRRVLELRLLERLPYEEVARQLGVPVGTVATWVRRLRIALGNDLGRGA
jgi:RNA polymerase sigma factor (sigma-70 family)